MWPFEKLVITYARWMKETSKPCSTCGSPVPDCYALCFVCLSDRQRRRIAELEAALNSQITDTALAEVKMEELEADKDELLSLWFDDAAPEETRWAKLYNFWKKQLDESFAGGSAYDIGVGESEDDYNLL